MEPAMVATEPTRRPAPHERAPLRPDDDPGVVEDHVRRPAPHERAPLRRNPGQRGRSPRMVVPLAPTRDRRPFQSLPAGSANAPEFGTTTGPAHERRPLRRSDQAAL